MSERDHYLSPCCHRIRPSPNLLDDRDGGEAVVAEQRMKKMKHERGMVRDTRVKRGVGAVSFPFSDFVFILSLFFLLKCNTFYLCNY